MGTHLKSLKSILQKFRTKYGTIHQIRTSSYRHCRQIRRPKSRCRQGDQRRYPRPTLRTRFGRRYRPIPKEGHQIHGQKEDRWPKQERLSSRSSTTTTLCQPDTLLTSQSTRKSSTKTASRTPPKNDPPRPTSKPPSKNDTRPARTSGSSRNSDFKLSNQHHMVLSSSSNGKIFQ